MMKKLLLLGLVALAFYGCTKDTWVFDDQTAVPGLDPSFAIPLVNTFLNIGDLEESLDSDNFIYNEDSEAFALVYRANVLDFSARELSGLGTESFDASYALTAGDATVLNGTPDESSVSLFESFSQSLAVSNGEEIETITFSEDTMFVTLNSEIHFDQDIVITIPEMTLNGSSFSETINAPYPGFDPFEVTAEFIITGYTLDLTQGQTTSNTFDVNLELSFTSNGGSVSAGDEIEMDIQIDLSKFKSVFGYFGQPATIENSGTQNVNLFKDLAGGALHFVEPRMELFFDNSSGISADVTFTSVYAPENSIEQELVGPDLSNIPQIARAANPGETETTAHTVDNDGVTPQLNTLLDEGPFTLIYSSEVDINSNGFDNNFLLDSSRILCRSEIILPFYGYADNFTMTDTLALDLVEEFASDEGDVLTIEDIERATIRMISDNGLPIEVGTQVYFVDSVYTVLDSLFLPGPFENLLDPGFIDFSLPEGDVNHGRVLASTRKITDISLTGQQLKHLAENHSTQVIIKAFGNTNNATDEVVKFFPEYNLGIKLSAKIDTNINFQE